MPSKLRTDPRPRIRAIVHTVGVTTNDGIYVPLEVAYADHSGLEKHFIVDCGVSRDDCCCSDFPFDPSKNSDVAATQYEIYSFLSRRFKALAKEFGHSRTFFGYKGLKLQSRFLCEAGVPNLANLDYYGVGKLKTLDPEYGGVNCCDHHVGKRGKCALRAVRLMAPIVFACQPRGDAKLRGLESNETRDWTTVETKVSEKTTETKESLEKTGCELRKDLETTQTKESLEKTGCECVRDAKTLELRNLETIAKNRWLWELLARIAQRFGIA